jgi:hypothetical protein
LRHGRSRRGQLNENERPIIMPFILALVFIAIVALIIVSFVVHLLFSPWLLLAAVAIVAWIKFRPRHTQR